jgi:hypothetical protein
MRLCDKSRMTGDCHVRFRERLGVKFPRPTRLATLRRLEFPRFHGHPELHLRLGFRGGSKHHLPSENATTAFYAQGFFLTPT